ncbi:MAG: nucleoside hydrolase [Coxiellaceae bacterium]|nr:nucleoside hydrolase [Coxiellaceae bacterium]
MLLSTAMKHISRIFLLLIGLCLCCTSAANHTRYLIDTDMGFDDWLSVVYLLEQPVDTAAITIDCQGLTFCPQGGDNAAKLTHMTHHLVPIALGRTRALSQYDFPKSLRDWSSAMDVPGFRHITTDHYNKHLKAANVIADTLIKAAKQHQKVAIISIGTATNIADAWAVASKRHQQDLFRQGLAMIYKGGGAFGNIEHGQLTNHCIAGNIFIPKISLSDNTSAEWNIYSNAPAMQQLLDADLPITFIPNNATDEVNITKATYHSLLNNSSPHSTRRFIANALLSSIHIGKPVIDWSTVSKNYDLWDTSVTLASLDPSIVMRTLHDVPVMIIENKGKRYGATWVSPQSRHHSNIYYKIDVSKFYNELLKHLA